MVEARSRRWGQVAAAVVVSIVFLLPFVLLASGSLRRPGLPPPRAPQLVPDGFAWSNYERAAELVGLGSAALNSVIVAALVVPLSVLVASWAGLALVLVGARVRTAVIALSVVALMMPLTALLVPRFAIFQWLGLVDSFAPLVAPALLGSSPFYVLVYFVAFRRLPRDLFDACRLEGMTPLTIWRRVAMPLVRPVTVAVGVLAFAFSWGNFLDPLIYLSDRDLFTLPLALRSLAALDPTNYPLLLAGAVVATAPVVAGLLIAQRYLFDSHRGPGWLGR